MVDILPFASPATMPLTVDAAALAPMLSIGLRTLRTWDAAGRLPRPVRVGGKVLWQLSEIRDWLEAGAPNRAEWEARKAVRPK